MIPPPLVGVTETTLSIDGGVVSPSSSFEQEVKTMQNIRLGELYLNLAEALNEANGPSQMVYDALNIVRSRAGIPNHEHK